MNNKKIILFSSIFILISALIFNNIFSNDKSIKKRYNKNDTEKIILNTNYNSENSLTDDKVDINYLIGLFKENYKDNLHILRSKIRLLGGIIKHYKKIYGDNWKEYLIDTITYEFQEYSDELLKYLDKAETYYAYINEDTELKELSLDDRRDKIWKKREEIFGDEYKEIWSSEIRKKEMKAFVEKLDLQAEMSFQQKLETFKNTTDELYSLNHDDNKDIEDIKIQKMKLSEKFLNMNTVQKELDQMDPKNRKDTLRNIRLSMGLDVNTVNRLEEIDKIRENLWKNGTAYSAIRDYIMSKFTGSEQKAKIDEARKKYFGTLADAIKNEEETFKYYRFNNPRKWGVD